jgi:shikimate dehydrogenase
LFGLVPRHFGAASLDAALAGLRGVENFAGAIVSMPHKTAIVSRLDALTPEAREVGAVNVIRRERGGRLIGTVLDGEGFVAGLRREGHEVAGRSCLLLGAGGAAAAIAFALARHGARSLAIANRTQSKALELAGRVHAAFPRLELAADPPADAPFDVVVNATSLGMRPGDALPLAPEAVARAGLVAECVIAPEITPLLARARELGRPIHTGVPMLAAQMGLMLDFMGAAQ